MLFRCMDVLKHGEVAQTEIVLYSRNSYKHK